MELINILKKPSKYIELSAKLVLGVLSMFISSCQKDWLNQKTQLNLEVPSSLQDYQAIMDNADLLMNNFSPSLGEVGSDGHYALDATLLGLQPNEINAYTWTHNSPYTAVDDWQVFTQRVFTCNLVLEGLDNLKINSNSDKQIWNNIKGQAYFQRARTLFETAQVWAPPFDSASASSDLSIPVRLQSDVNIKSTNSTVQETYDQVISDLMLAKDLLPITPLYKTRGSKPAVYAELARVYLTTGNYVLAASNADSCLNLYNTLLDYNLVDSTIQFPFPLLGNEVIFQSNLDPAYITISPYASLIDTALFIQYSNDDLRKALFFLVNSDGTIGFRGTYNGQSYIEFNGIATDEVMLIYAECLARESQIGLAIDELNSLLTTRWRKGLYVPIVENNADSALTLILTERKKELILRGLRWGDLRRLNNDKRFAIPISHIENGIVYTLQPKSFQYTFPIPDDIIQLSRLKQNNGW